LAVVEGKSEKIRFRINHMMGEMNYIKHKIICSYVI
jgi:hypothetical protein